MGKKRTLAARAVRKPDVPDGMSLVGGVLLTAEGVMSTMIPNAPEVAEAVLRYTAASVSRIIGVERAEQVVHAALYDVK